MALGTNWWFDIKETGAVDREYSIGPIRLESETSVEEFMILVNDKFEDAYYAGTGTQPAGTVATLYELTVEGIGGNMCESWGQAQDYEHDNVYFGIKYRIRAVNKSSSTDFKFKFLWATGPHGTLQVDATNEDLYPNAEITVVNDSSVKAFLFPWHAGSVAMILDKPPVPPFVDIKPYKGINNKLLILLDGNIGDIWYRPVVIKDSDFEQIRAQYTAQYGIVLPDAAGGGMEILDSYFAVDNELARINAPELPGAVVSDDDTYRELGLGRSIQNIQTYLPVGSPGTGVTPAGAHIRLNYKSDDPPRIYEIYRISEKPTSYRDFNTSQNPIQTVTTNLGHGKFAVPASFIDTVAPNTKYYYCFRCVDVHNNFSNPTIVYEAQLVDNDGQVYFVLKPYYFNDKIEKRYKKAGRKYIYIEPTVRQVSLLPNLQGLAAYDTEMDDLLTGGIGLNTILPTDEPPDSVLGPSPAGSVTSTDLKVWDKKFKVRVISKKTGKKFDLNLTFENKGVDIP